MTTQPKLHRSAARPYRACAKTWPNFGRGARRIFSLSWGNKSWDVRSHLTVITLFVEKSKHTYDLQQSTLVSLYLGSTQFHVAPWTPHLWTMTASRQRPNTTSGAIQGMDPRMVCLDKQIGRNENCNGWMDRPKAVEPWNFAPTICAKFNDKSHGRNRRLKACSVNPRHVKVSSVRLEQPKSANFTVSPASELWVKLSGIEIKWRVSLMSPL